MADKNIRTIFCLAEPKPQLSWAEWLYFQCGERSRGVLWRRCNLARLSVTLPNMGFAQETQWFPSNEGSMGTSEVLPVVSGQLGKSELKMVES